mgnify:CR=1 FL=1
MNAQEKLIEYGNEIKAKSNTALKDMTAQEIIGQAFVEGICFFRTPASRTTCEVKRTWKTIVVTETIIAKVNEIVDGKLISRETRETTEVMTVQL